MPHQMQVQLSYTDTKNVFIYNVVLAIKWGKINAFKTG